MHYITKVKIENALFNRKLGLAIALSAPIVFLTSAWGFAHNVGFSVFQKRTNITQMVSTPNSDNAYSAFFDKTKPVFTKPMAISITPTKSIELEVVGVDDAGVLQVPSDWNRAGWYISGARVGEKGNMIINGHYDDNGGKPAAFWELKNLKIGDKVTVLDSNGKEFIYVVSDSVYVAIDDPNRLKILNYEDGKPTMTLITCGGFWLPGKSTYNKRLIVKAVLIS